MKNILGLDLGTTSIGWALINQDIDNKTGNILGLGSRIIPIDQNVVGEFKKGNSVSQTADRTKFRSGRRLRERHLLRRERLHRVLNILTFLPEHYANQIDFEKKIGKFKEELEPKLVYDKKEFIFKDSFEEMLNDFKQYQPQLLLNKNGGTALVPYDWTIFYLRKKALSQKIDKQELAWILLNFNQKRGYYQLRGEEEEENPNKLIEYHSLIVIDVEADEKPNSKGDLWYSLTLENGWIYRRSSKTSLVDWKGKKRDFIVTVDLNDDGSVKLDKDGIEKRSFRAPKEDDWGLVKKKTEQEINQSEKTVGTYIYDSLLQNPRQKIKGQLVRTIERRFYKDELKTILEKQIELQPELFTKELYNSCVRELYRNNEAHQLSLTKKDFLHLFIEDIIFYQRPLRSQKSSIGTCSLEKRPSKDNKGNILKYENGKPILFPLKAIPKSNPYYQEFRVWQWLSNLKIYLNSDDKDVTNQFIKDETDLENLFEFLMSKKEVNHTDVLKHFFKDLKGKTLISEVGKYRWNYVYDSDKKESKTYPMNETGYEIKRRLNKTENHSANFLTREIEQQLWHIIYSVTDQKDYEKALVSFALKNHLDEISFVENFKKFLPFKSEYGAYSEKAIKKILPLLRLGKYWDFDSIDAKTKIRIDKIINAEDDDNIRLIVREKTEKHELRSKNHFQYLPLWLAQYIVYDRHSEAEVAGKWNSISDLESFLENFKQHSLRNPIVEQIVTEALRVVKDIWLQYGNGAEDFFDEIHIELGREMKHTADERKRITSVITENENTNLRIKALLLEMMNDSEVEEIRHYSPMQQEILKIYEEGVLNSNIEVEEEIVKISKKADPTKSELQRYKLWLEQKYRSPYTGEIISLNRLFTHDYEIEHIIPKSLFFDDSFSNKVICESAVNQLKSNQLGLEFVKNNYGQKVSIGYGVEVKIFTEEQYKEFVNDNYSKNRSKRSKLLLEEIPEKMIERQLNDTRYISKFISNTLSNLVRSKDNDEGVNSKNILSLNGKITSELKQDWGLNDVWNDLILPRFERMNKLTSSSAYTSYNQKHQKFLPIVPFEYSKGFQKKRIDHRHHAMDALIIACATRSHINLLNNLSAKETDLTNEEKKKRQIESRNKLKNSICSKKRGDRWIFNKPWSTFTEDTKRYLETTIVSFKQNLRVINKATNKYEKWIVKDGQKKKELVEQEGINWAIRKPMHIATFSGKIDLPRIKVPKDKISTATRKKIDTSFTHKTLESISDSGIEKILGKYLTSKDDNSELAFSPEGIEELNKNIKQFNKGKFHHPIFKVRIFEVGNKFSLGQFGSKKDKYVEAAKGTNLFFAVYERRDTKARMYDTIPLNEVIEHQKLQVSLGIPKINRIEIPLKKTLLYKGKDIEVDFLFSLSPNDLVYVPETDENVSTIDFNNLTKEKADRIYKMVSSTGNKCYFIQSSISFPIISYDSKSKIGELGSLNKLEVTLQLDKPIRIKEECIKLKIDRLGNISKVK